MTKNKPNNSFRIPYGCIALGGVLAMAASFFVPGNGILMFFIGMVVVVMSLTFALCRALGKPGGFWPWF